MPDEEQNRLSESSSDDGCEEVHTVEKRELLYSARVGPPAIEVCYIECVEALPSQGEDGMDTAGELSLNTTPSFPLVACPKDSTLPPFAAEFVFDVSIPDDSLVVLGETFVKTWRIANIGSHDWEGCVAVHAPVSEEEGRGNLVPVAGPEVVIPDCPSGSWCDLSVTFHVPVTASLGSSRSKWHLRTSRGGHRFDRGFLRYLFMDCDLCDGASFVPHLRV